MPSLEQKSDSERSSGADAIDAHFEVEARQFNTP